MVCEAGLVKVVHRGELNEIASKPSPIGWSITPMPTPA
jgi:hypothetical protein